MIIQKLKKFIFRSLFIYRSKKVSKLLKNIVQGKKYNILDVGAGGRYLPSVLNFDGISKIYMVDPNENLETSYNNLKKKLNFKKSLIKINYGIYSKDMNKKYYHAKKSTGSSFLKYDNNLIEKKKFVYTYKTLKKKFKIGKLDILKVDVEGLENIVLSQILKDSLPLIIEIELNFAGTLFGDTFTNINNKLSKKYELYTCYSTYKNIFRRYNGHINPFVKGDYHNPINRNQINQMDCYYLLKKKKYNLNDVVLLYGYGFVDKAKDICDLDKDNLSVETKKNLKKLFYV